MNVRVIFGATSAIAHATARVWAARGDALVVVGRAVGALEDLAQDLRVRGAARVSVVVSELSEVPTQSAMLERVLQVEPEFDTALIAYGSLTDQERAERDVEYAVRELHVNFVSQAALLLRVASYFEMHRRGTVALIGSVAGDRGRQSNFVYGSAKGGAALFAQGLRNRLSKSRVHVLTIKPGFVDTPMTQHLRKSFLFAAPATVAGGIVKAIDRSNDVVYLPFFWRLIMLVIVLIPERFFKRLRI